MWLSFRQNRVTSYAFKCIAPTSDHNNEELEEFYDLWKEAAAQVKSGAVVIHTGDWNAKVGNEEHGQVEGKYGLGERNERGSRLVNFCEENDLMIANTWYQQHTRRLQHPISPGDICRYQMDFILVSRRYGNAVKHVKTYPGADIGSDHVPVVMNIHLRLKKISNGRKTIRPNLEILKDESIRQLFPNNVSNRYEGLACEEPMQIDDSESIDNVWKNSKSSNEETVEDIISDKEEKKQNG